MWRSGLLLVLLWLSFVYASYNGAMVATSTEIMPVEIHTSGFSLAYSLATALLGGLGLYAGRIRRTLRIEQDLLRRGRARKSEHNLRNFLRDLRWPRL
jgi:hypothetical protein